MLKENKEEKVLDAYSCLERGKEELYYGFSTGPAVPNPEPPRKNKNKAD